MKSFTVEFSDCNVKDLEICLATGRYGETLEEVIQRMVIINLCQLILLGHLDPYLLEGR